MNMRKVLSSERDNMYLNNTLCPLRETKTLHIDVLVGRSSMFIKTNKKLKNEIL